MSQPIPRCKPVEHDACAITMGEGFQCTCIDTVQDSATIWLLADCHIDKAEQPDSIGVIPFLAFAVIAVWATRKIWGK